MTCEYCSPANDDVLGPTVEFLPTPDWQADSCGMAVAPSDGEYYVCTNTYPVNVAGPISHCPMCGRDLRGDER